MEVNWTLRHIGKPKQPTITICKLVEGEYQMEKFVAGNKFNSSIFSKLDSTTDAIFQADYK